MYSIRDYGEMTNDRRRTNAYADALHELVTPESAVLDIGAGAGMLTLLACQAGARRVYAVESEQVIDVARELAAANGFSDRVEFIQGMSTDIELPEKVDVIVSDVHGVLPFFTAGLKSILDARDRFLKPGGSMIPAREPLWVGVASDPAYYQRIVGPWEKSYGLDGVAGRRRAVNSWTKSSAASSEMLAEPRVWAVLDYTSMTEVSGR